MQNKYLTIWLSMEPDTWMRAKELGVAPASMTAIVNRGMVEATNSSPKRYRRMLSAATVLFYLLERYKNEMSNYIDIFCRNRELAMMCSVKNGVVYDCYDNKFDISEAYKVRIGTRYFSLVNGKEIV